MGRVKETLLPENDEPAIDFEGMQLDMARIELVVLEDTVERLLWRMRFFTAGPATATLSDIETIQERIAYVRRILA